MAIFHDKRDGWDATDVAEKWIRHEMSLIAGHCVVDEPEKNVCYLIQKELPEVKFPYMGWNVALCDAIARNSDLNAA